MRLHFSTAAAAVTLGLALAGQALSATPTGWIVAGTAPDDYEFAVENTTAASGTKSASITAKPDARPEGFGTLMQTIAADDYRASRWRLSAYMRTEGAHRAQMWMRIDGPLHKVLGFDNMGSRPVTGTTGWTQYDIVLDVPAESVAIAFGFFLNGGGKVWADGFRLEKVEATVPMTPTEPVLPRSPRNLDFEE